MPFATVNNIKMFYDQQGQGKDLILLGGMTSNHLGWQRVLPHLTSQFKVLRPDNRSAGQSDAPISPFTIKDMAEDIIQLMDQLNIEQAYIVGHSMGGMMAQYIAVHYPERVIKLMLSSCSAKVPEASVFQINTKIKLMAAKLAPELILDSSIPWLFGNHFLSDKNRLQETLKIMMSNPYPQTEQGYIGQVNAVSQFNLMNEISKIKAKTFVVVGEEDLLTPVFCSRYLHEHIAESELIVLEKMGHIPQIENPEKMAQIILEKFS